MLEIIQAGHPGADKDLAEHLLWERTPYPFGPVNAQSLYKVASLFRRANASGIRLCDLCNERAAEGRWTCDRCSRALARCNEENALRRASRITATNPEGGNPP